MPSTTIDYGIDLGTTNSAIAVWREDEPEVIENNENAKTTPSAVWLDGAGQLVTGTRRAYEQAFTDGERAYRAFKRQMGTDHVYQFARDGRTMRSEDLSAEVLKELKKSVAQRRADDLQAAVVTVPAAFDLAQSDATRRAAELADIRQVVLLQEPVAASLAYRDAGTSRHPWLVYDLGGGTFDAAIMEARDGELRVINHVGDNWLGGGDIDRAITDELLVPRLVGEHGLRDLRRGDRRGRATMGWLDLAAEIAKIGLSSQPSGAAVVDFLPTPDGQLIRDFSEPLTRSQVAELARPYLIKTVRLAREAIAEAGLQPGDVERVLLVGGPTLAPYLRELLADPDEGLGIELALDPDPMTIVARGAAIYASQQLRETERRDSAVLLGSFVVQLPEWRPTGPDEEIDIVGRVQAPFQADLQGYELQVERRGAGVLPWRSGRIPLNAQGAFMVTLVADSERTAEFRLRLFTPSGEEAPVATQPETLTYRVTALAAPPAPLTHNVGVALVTDQPLWFHQKGDPLPAQRTRRVVQSDSRLSRRDDGGIVIPVIEGTSRLASRNREVGKCVVPPKDLESPVPVGTEIEVTIEIDASRLVSATAYVPFLGQSQSYEMEPRLLKSADPDMVLGDARKALERLEQVRELAEGLYVDASQQKLDDLDREGLPAQVTQLAEAVSRGDSQEKEHCVMRTQELEARLDDAESALEWPAMEQEAQRTLEFGENVVRDFGDEEDRATWRLAAQALHEAMATRDVGLVRQRDSDATTIAVSVLNSADVLPILQLGWFGNRRDTLTDQRRAGTLLERGERAREAGDIATVRQVVRDLFELLPPGETPPTSASTVDSKR